MKAPYYIFDADDLYVILIAGMRYSAETEAAAIARAEKELREWRAMGRDYRSATVTYRRTGEVVKTITSKDL